MATKAERILELLDVELQLVFLNLPQKQKETSEEMVSAMAMKREKLEMR